MDSTFRFAFPFILYSGCAVLLIALWYQLIRKKQPLYLYPMTHIFIENASKKLPYKKFIQILRFLILIGLLLLSARPQWIDKQSKVNVEGIDIVLAIDVSGSMQLFDDPSVRKERLEIAKDEAMKFIKKRENDPIGLILFGQEAVTRCPLTLDKKMLDLIIRTTELGVINPQGTMLSKGLLMSINRLKKSTAKTKIIILLTDGEPTEGDENPKNVVALAKKYGIKVYTIGIGGKDGGYLETPFGIQKVAMPFRTDLLKFFAQETGGKYFHATNQDDLNKIYDAINKLEKTEYETHLFQRYEDIIMPYMALVIGMLFFEILLTHTWWFGL